MPKKKMLLICFAAILFLFFIYFSYLVAKERFTRFDFDTTVRLQDHISRKFDLPFLMLSPVALFIELFGKLFVYHPSPPHMFYRGVIHFNLPSSYVPVEYSYPSGHVTRTAFIIVFLIGFLYFRRTSNYRLLSVVLYL